MSGQSHSYEKIHAEVIEDGAVLKLVLDSPKGNVLDSAMMSELLAALDEHRDNPDVKMVLLSAAGKHFSFGASVEEHQADQAAAMLSSFHELCRKLVRYPVPICAAVTGRCLGGAFEVVLCCHFVFATENAVFGCPEIKLGVFPPVLAVLGHMRLGGAMADRLLLTGGDLHSSTARDIGFLTAQNPDDGDLEATVLQWYQKHLQPLSAFSIRQATTAIRSGSGMADAVGEPLEQAEKHYLTMLIPSHDGNEGIQAFLERRKPVWKNS